MVPSSERQIAHSSLFTDVTLDCVALNCVALNCVALNGLTLTLLMVITLTTRANLFNFIFNAMLAHAVNDIHTRSV